MSQQDTKTPRKHKSIKLPVRDKAKLIAAIGRFPSKDVAATQIGLKNRNTLDRVIAYGSGSQETIETIQTWLSDLKATA